MKKTNNKGFSLVELIIVIAIMAILIGVLAPQYIKYVEKSRVSSDKDMIDSVTKAVQTACTDEDYYDGLSNGDAVSISKANGIGTAGSTLQLAIDEFYGTTGGADSAKKFKSKAFASETITITIVDQSNAAGASTYSAKVEDSKGIYNPANYK